MATYLPTPQNGVCQDCGDAPCGGVNCGPCEPPLLSSYVVTISGAAGRFARFNGAHMLYHNATIQMPPLTLQNCRWDNAEGDMFLQFSGEAWFLGCADGDDGLLTFLNDLFLQCYPVGAMFVAGCGPVLSEDCIDSAAATAVVTEP